MKKIVFGLFCLCTIAGCAKRANSIVPVDIPIAAYSNLDCPTLANELLTEQEKLAIQTKKQNEAATGDAVGVFLIGVPTASLTGYDREGELAVTKGKVLSIENAMRSKSCGNNSIENLGEPVSGTTPKPAS